MDSDEVFLKVRRVKVNLTQGGGSAAPFEATDLNADAVGVFMTTTYTGQLSGKENAKRMFYPWSTIYSIQILEAK